MTPARRRLLQQLMLQCCCAESGSPGSGIVEPPSHGSPNLPPVEPCDACTPRTNPNAPLVLDVTVTVCGKTATGVLLTWSNTTDSWSGFTLKFNPFPPGLPNWLGPCPTCNGLPLPLSSCFANISIYCRSNVLRAAIEYVDGTNKRWVREIDIPADAFTCDPFFAHFSATATNNEFVNCSECLGSGIEITATRSAVPPGF